jgi:hypothetical protein
LAPVDPNPAAGTAIHFDAVDDVVEVAHNSTLNAFPLTITAWTKTLRDTPDYFGVVNKYFGGSGNGYSLHIQNGRVYAWYFSSAGSWVYPGDPGFGGTFVADGQWHHLALVVDASGGRLYVDGVETANRGWTGAAGACTTTIPLTFGKYPTLISLPGRIDEVTLWNRSLSVGEIGSLMRFGASGAESGLLGYWPFDEGSGNVAMDATGHGFNGALQNGALWAPSDAPLFP